MKNTALETAHTPKELLAELQTLVAEAEKMMSDTATEKTEDVLESLHGRFVAAQERFAELCEGAKKKVVAGAKCTDAAIRENPYQALAIAAGVGLVAGILLGRRSK